MNDPETAFTVTLGTERRRYVFAQGLLFVVQPGVRELLARCSSVAVAKTLAIQDARLCAGAKLGVPIVAMELL